MEATGHIGSICSRFGSSGIILLPQGTWAHKRLEIEPTGHRDQQIGDCRGKGLVFPFVAIIHLSLASKSE